MIASLSGVVASVAGGAAVLEVGGVGYLVQAPAGVLAGLVPGRPARLLTYMVVREDSLTLYGFAAAGQRDLFQTLIGIGGVGPKIALAILSVFDPDALRLAVAAGDADALTAVPGVGKRSAQRILLDLKERLDVDGDLGGPPSARVAEVREALVALGYAPSELRGVLERVAGSDGPVEEMVRAALRELSRV